MKARVPQGPSMNAMLKQAQKMQEDMANLQAELEEREYEISAGGGAVKIKINGKKEIVGLRSHPRSWIPTMLRPFPISSQQVSTKRSSA